MMSTTEGELDVEVTRELEDGELEESDVEDGTYIPLERPDSFNPPSLVNMQIQDEQSDEGSLEESTGSDSDDELRRRPKRTKIRPKRPQQANTSDKKEKYKIWCKTVQEDLLTEDMGSCDVTKKNEYGVESYDYTIKYRLNDSDVSKNIFTDNNDILKKDSNKRKHYQCGNIKLRLGKRVNSNQPREKQEPRHLPDLTLSIEDPIDILSSEIAVNLEEEKKDLVKKIVEVVGAKKAVELYNETQRIETEGGILVMNGTRRRTPGGVYFLLLKHADDISQEIITQIFNEDRKETTRKIKKSRAKTRQKVMEQLKQSLTDSELPSLLSRGEAVSQTEHGSNPPPSPATDATDATDARDCSSDNTDNPRSPPRDPRSLQHYDDDDYLEVICNEEMDVF